MSYHEKTWPNFVDYLSWFEPYAKFRERFVAYFGNSNAPPTGFRNRTLGLYNPLSNRRS